MGSDDTTRGDTTPRPPSLKQRGGSSRDIKAPSSSEEGVGGGVDRLRHRLYERAAESRLTPTEPEKRVWSALRSRSFEAYKFRRQAVIGARIVDFFCPSKGLVVEIDGMTHDRQADEIRDAAMMRDHGFETVRFTNDEVMRNLPGVLEALTLALGQTPDRWTARDTTPQPPPLKRRGSIGEALREVTARLGSDWARDDAEILMAHALGVSRSAMLLGRMRDEPPAAFEAMVARRLADEPVAYILGEAEFYGRRFKVTPDVLIPRADSETTLAVALEAAPSPGRVLDCGTGSGILLLSLLAERPAARGIGIDRSANALAVAAENALALGLTGRVELRQADWNTPGWAHDLGLFDLVIANPPYVEDNAEIDRSVCGYEPSGALFAGPDGLDAYRILIPQLPALLAPKGAAVIEIGHRQADAVTALAEASNFDAALHHDLAGRPRALTLVRKGLAKAP